MGNLVGVQLRLRRWIWDAVSAQILGVHTEKQSAFRPHTTVRRRTSGFWATDRSLTILLILLIGNIFSSPLAEFATWGVFAARTTLSLIIISDVIATVPDRRLIALTIALLVGSLFLRWEGLERSNAYLHLVNDFTALLFLGLLVALILRQVLRDGPITARRVQGLVAAQLAGLELWFPDVLR
jgi:hypothetical protein